MRIARVAAALVAALALAAAVLWTNDALQDRIVARVARTAIEARSADALFADDALRVLVCGSSSPLPHPARAKACVAVFAGGRFYLVDSGPGAWNRLALWRIPGERIGAVFLTHFHSDHIGDLGEVDLQTWVAGRPQALAVVGPTGVERVTAGFDAAYALDADYRIAHHGAALLAPDREPLVPHVLDPISLDAGESVLALEEQGLRVTAFLVDHSPVSPAVGYRFDYRGRSVVVSGDTKPVPALARAAQGADVLVHEAQANHMVAILGREAGAAGNARVAKIMGDIPSYHTSPVEAAQLANQAGVRLLVLYHLTPPPTNPLVERVFLRGMAGVRDAVVLARDGTLVELPIGSEAFDVRQLD